MKNSQISKIRLMLLFFLLCTGKGWAQNDDWGLWTNIGVEKQLSKKWSLGLGGEYRWKEDITLTDQVRGSLDTEYKVWKFLKIGAGYELIADKKKKKDIFAYRHRFKIEAQASYKISRFTLSWRPRLQTTLYDNIELDDDDLDNYKWVIRNRFGLKYNIPKIPLKPYIQFETFNHIFSDIQPSYYKSRFSAGLEYSITKHHGIDLSYKHDSEILNDKKYTLNVIAAGYKFSF